MGIRKPPLGGATLKCVVDRVLLHNGAKGWLSKLKGLEQHRLGTSNQTKSQGEDRVMGTSLNGGNQQS